MRDDVDHPLIGLLQADSSLIEFLISLEIIKKDKSSLSNWTVIPRMNKYVHAKIRWFIF